MLSVTSQSTAPQYDGRGNMTRDHQGQTYEYDHYNRLSGVGTSIDLTYDPAGRLQETSTDGPVIREMQYDGLDLIAEYSNTGTLTARVACPGPVPGCTAPGRTSRWCNMPARRCRRGNGCWRTSGGSLLFCPSSRRSRCGRDGCGRNRLVGRGDPDQQL